MNLRELKKMVAQEYNAYLREQAAATPAAPGAPAAPPAIRPTPPAAGPGITVGPDDINVDDDGGNAEEILNSIYNMLKGHFEASDNDMDIDMDDDMDDMDMDDMEDDDMDDEDMGDIEDDEEDIEENTNSVGPNAGYKALNESVARFQKLANIKK